MSDNAKVLVCIECGTNMIVPKNSGRKWCDECYRHRRNKKAQEKYIANSAEARERAAERMSEKMRDDPQYRLYKYARQKARENSLDFDLTVEDIEIPEVCPVLGTPFIYRTYYTVSLDRIDSNKGYTKNNVQVMSHKANAMKNSATEEELIAFADWVYSNLKEED